MPSAPDVGEQPMPPVSKGKEQPEDSSEYRHRKQLLLLLAVLVASVTYLQLAGFSPPGGVWQEEGGAGVTAGSPILLSIHRGRYLAFFYCNATALMASLVMIIFLLRNKSLTSWVQLAVLRLVMVLDLLGLMGAYLAGSCRERTTTVYTAALVLALSTYIGVHILLALYSRSHVLLKPKEWPKVLLLLLANLATAAIYVAGGLNPPRRSSGGFWDGAAPPAAMTRVLLKPKERPKVLLLLAYFATAVTYVAGLNPPGYGYYSGHHRMFFYCNSTAFVASLFIIVQSLKGYLQDIANLDLDRAYSSDEKSEEQLRWILEPEAEAVTRRQLNPSDPGKIQLYLHEKKLIYFMEKSPSLLAISGMAGVGKTNLLKVLRNKYKSSFRYVFFAGAACGVDLLQHVIFINLGLGPPPQMSDVPVAKIISSFLKEESFLLLLDDLRETLDLAAVGLPMPLVGHQQKVIFTTRSQAICDSMGCGINTTIHLQCLEEEDAWSLFRDKVGDEIIHAHPQIKHLAKKIVAECGGLPSTLCTVGRAMSSKRDVKEWRNAYDLLKMKRPPPSEIQGPNEIQEIGDDGYILENASRTTQLYNPSTQLGEIESEDEGLDEEIDDDAEDEHEHEAEDAVPAEPTVQNATAPPPPPKDTERQLSKKELKKKELAELDAVLAELGLGASSNSTQDETNGKKGADQAADGEKKEDAPAPSESKSSKKKKAKKDKSSKEAKEAQDQTNGSEDAAGAEPDEDTTSVDVKERIKKVASMKKKKSSKEMDAAAKIATSEAAARSARIAAAKKKEKSHYNQQPVR